MAERRMMAKSITESDAFLSMPVSAQALYFHLMQHADDEGVIANARSVMRMCLASDDDAMILIKRKFLIAIGTGEDAFILLVKHWRIHNYIQKDRFKESNYRKFLKDVYIDNNGAYTENPEDGKPLYPECIQHVSRMETQDRLGKSKDRVRDSLGQVGIGGQLPPTLPNGEPLPEWMQTGNDNIDSAIAAAMAFSERRHNGEGVN